MKTNQIHQSIIPAALVAAVAFSVWYGMDRSATDGALQPAATARVQPSPAPVFDIPATDVSSNAEEVVADNGSVASQGRMIFSKPKNVTGQALNIANVEDFNIPPQTLRGRSAELDAESFASLNDLAEGDTVSFPSFDGEMHGVVEVAVIEENGWKRVGGPLEGDRNKGWFSFGFDGREAVGLVRLNGEKVAYQISAAGSGRLAMTERPLKDFFCMGMPLDIPRASSNHHHTTAAPAPVVTPILNSRPGAVAALLLDFDGANVNDPDWGRINAGPSPLTAPQRADVFRRVKDDFLAFNINVTTDQAKYAAAPVGSRMRCIITPDDTAAPGAGGVAYLHSFAYAGKIFSKNIPCWVFNPTVKSVADAISHEFGHTFGLNHDGLVGQAEYYVGHGVGATSWGPIMGAPYTRSLNQWSKGEYKGANCYEFDVEAIANDVNGFGFAPDDFGDTPVTASPISFSGTVIEQHGVIDRLGDEDVFSITLPNGGGLLVSASGLGSQVGNLDLGLEVLDSAGKVIATNKLDKSLGSGLNVSLGKGVSYLRVRAVGEGDVKGTGYSKYGCDGAYTIAGRLPP